jgi:hypothetical protein
VLIQGDKIFVADFSIPHDGLFQPYRSSSFFAGAATLARLSAKFFGLSAKAK